MVEFYGLEGQDEFAFQLLKHIRNGFYIDCCCQHWKEASNTLVFEEQLGWTGLGFDFATEYHFCGPFNWEGNRKGEFIQMDVNTPEFTEVLLQKVNGLLVDYVSFDVDHTGVNYGWDVLPRLINGGIRFKVMTLEHEFYTQGERVREPTRQLLHQLGYKMLFSDVSHIGGEMSEDWWIHPKYFPSRVFNYGGDGLYWKECVKRIKGYE